MNENDITSKAGWRDRTKAKVEHHWKTLTSDGNFVGCCIFILLGTIWPILTITVALVYFPRTMAACITVMVATYCWLAVAGILNVNAIDQILIQFAVLYLQLSVPIVVVAIFNAINCAAKLTYNWLRN